MTLTPPPPAFTLSGEVKPPILRWQLVDMGRCGCFLVANSSQVFDGVPLEWWIEQTHRGVELFADVELFDERRKFRHPREAMQAAEQFEINMQTKGVMP